MLYNFVIVPDPIENAHTSILIPNPHPAWEFSNSHGAAIFTPVSQVGSPRLREVTDFSKGDQHLEKNRGQHTRPEPFLLRAKGKQTSHDFGFYFWGVPLAYNTLERVKAPLKI